MRLVSILLLTLIVANLTLPVYAQSDIQARVVGDNLNLRTQPNRESAALDQLAYGALLRITGRNDSGEWIFGTVIDSGTAGWAAAQYLEFPAGFDIFSLPVTTNTGSQGAPISSGAGSATARSVNLRSGPGTLSPVIQLLPAETAITPTGRSADNGWVQADVNGQSGWLFAELLRLDIDINTLPVIEIAAPVAAGPVSIPAGVVPTVGARTRQIFRAGQALDNQPNAFSKIGDSITHTLEFLFPIGWGNYTLGEYANLQQVIYRFSGGDENSFSRYSLGARAGWTTYDLLREGMGDPEFCESNETPLECEYRVHRPSLALIMIGTNDAAQGLGSRGYRGNLQEIVQISIDHGVIPVLSTLPDNLSSPERSALVLEYNDVVRAVAAQYGIPLWDYWLALQALPNKGIGGDGAHPNSDPVSGSTTIFTAEWLQYGFTMRNLTALMVLDTVWRAAMR
jgi:uncharacterized protein YraI